MKVTLYDCFKNWYHGGVIWVYSDPHFQRNKEMENAFGWPTPEERLYLINECVMKNDTFVCLGDVGDKVEMISKIRTDYKVLVTGNHDKGKYNYKRRVLDCGVCKTEEEAKAICKSGLMHTYSIGDVKPDGYISVGGTDDERFILRKDNHLFDEIYDGPIFINQKLVLSHERFETPYAINVHGHEHGGVYATEENYITEEGDYTSYLINVASDVIDFRPVRLDKILEMFPLKRIKSIHEATIEYARKKKVPQ